MLKRTVSCVVSMAMCVCLAQPVALAEEVTGAGVPGGEVVSVLDGPMDDTTDGVVLKEQAEDPADDQVDDPAADEEAASVEEVVADEEGVDELTVAADGDIELPPISFPTTPSNNTNTDTDNKGENELPEDVITDNDISKIVTVTIAKQTYTGRQIKPVLAVALKLGGALKRDVDYTVEWGQNINVGTGSVTIKGKGNYTGSLTVNFPIVAATLSKSCKVAAIASRTYTGKQIKPEPVVTRLLGTATLVKGTDYTLSWGQNTNAGTGTVTVTGKGNYTGSVTASFPIAAASITKVAKFSAVGKKTYTGKRILPKPVVRLASGGAKLVKDKDYTLTWGTNKKVGKGTVTITGKGNYQSSKTITFNIVEPAAPKASYRVRVQGSGWTKYSRGGAVAGTYGVSKRVGAVQIKLAKSPYKGGIQYRTLQQSGKWQGWKKDGKVSGTAKGSKRVEAIQIKLYGELAKHYDVYYRVHTQNYGWMGWAKNGAKAGTAGYSYRLEAIQIVVVKKGAKKPAKTYKGVKTVTAAAFKQKK